MPSRPDPIRIHDLDKPEFLDFVVDILNSARDSRIELSIDAVQSAAAELAGQPAYEDPGYLERLAVLLQAMNEDGDLSPFGRANNFNIIVHYAARLR